MKKTYINPAIDVVVLNMGQQLLAGSELGLGADGNANEAESRDFDFDDEE